MSIFYRMARSLSRIVGPDSRVVRAIRPLSESLISWTSGQQGLSWDINGTPCRIDPRFRAQLARSYDADLARMLRERIRSGQTCLDVGANIGAWVIQFANMVGPTGRVVAFEPNPTARAILEDHIRMNDLKGRTTVVPAAAGSQPGEVTFFAEGADGMSRIGEPNPLLADKAVAITVPVLTLDTWCRENKVKPDWMLIDVEGFEGHVLAGAAETIRTHQSMLGIIVEMHPSLWASAGLSAESMAAQFAAIARRPVPLTGQKDLYAEYGHILLEAV